MKSKVLLEKFDAKKGHDRKANVIKLCLWFVVKIVLYQSRWPFPYPLKRLVLILFGAEVGKNLVIKPCVNILYPWKLRLGENVWIGEEVIILNFENIKIGNNVCISQRVFLCGGNHNYRSPEMKYKNGGILINDGCWVCANSVIMPDSELGVDTVVTACSLAHGNLMENSIYSGIPAKFIKLRWI